MVWVRAALVDRDMSLLYIFIIQDLKTSRDGGGKFGMVRASAAHRKFSDDPSRPIESCMASHPSRPARAWQRPTRVSKISARAHLAGEQPWRAARPLIVTTATFLRPAEAVMLSEDNPAHTFVRACVTSGHGVCGVALLRVCVCVCVTGGVLRGWVSTMCPMPSQHIYGCLTVVLVGVTCPARTVVTVILRLS